MMVTSIACGFCLISFNISNLKYQATPLLKYCNLNFIPHMLVYFNAAILLMVLLCSGTVQTYAVLLVVSFTT